MGFHFCWILAAEVLVIIRILFACSLLTLTGCQSVDYYSQAISGQFGVLSRADSIKSLLLDPGTNQSLKDQLKKIQTIRSFAVEQLGARQIQSFLNYSDLDRDYVVWNVFVTPKLSLDPIEWCFPFAGCVNYRGYFKEDQAQKFAQQNRLLGRDTFILGVPAYSTLGWFSDPVLSTFIHYSDIQLVGLMFHELAHQIVYVQDDTAFNESFAVSVEIQGVTRWLEDKGSPAEKKLWVQGRSRNKEFLRLFNKTRDRLKNIYLSSLNDSKKLKEKNKIILNLNEEYGYLKKKWMGVETFDMFASGTVNNATFVPLRTYGQHVPFFTELLKNEKSFQSFFKKVETLAKMPKKDREMIMKSLVPQ